MDLRVNPANFAARGLWERSDLASVVNKLSARLAEARELAKECRANIANRIDPLAARFERSLSGRLTLRDSLLPKR